MYGRGGEGRGGCVWKKLERGRTRFRGWVGGCYCYLQ